MNLNERGKPTDTTSVLLFPSFKRIAQMKDEVGCVVKFVLQNLLPVSQGGCDDRQDPLQSEEVDYINVFICGHNKRDKRCGIMGPLLKTQFLRLLPTAGIRVLKGEQPRRKGLDELPELAAKVNLISHIGGHKFAGNVIIYIPPAIMTNSPLAGKGIWYGRVEPKHVQGIIYETILGGRIIQELLRGVKHHDIEAA